MGINVILEYEDGEQISEVVDSRGTVSGIASAAHSDRSYRLLCYLDPWGDTVFNTLQIPDLIEDLELAHSQCHDDHDRQLLSRVIAPARQVHEEPHRYLRFVGD